MINAYELNPEKINNLIKNKRLKLKLTQSYVCKNTGLSKAFISEIENNKKSISFDTFIKLNKVLNLLEEIIITED